MRLWETSFLIVLLIYHISLLVPRYRRAVAWNWLAPLAALLAVVGLALEGFRWTELPPLAVLLLDLVWFMISYRRLRGRLPKKGFLSRLGGFTRSIVASFFFLVAAAGISLVFWFPLPEVPASGGYPVALRILVVKAQADLPDLTRLFIWYPAAGSSLPAVRPIQTRAAWLVLNKEGGPPPVLDSHWALIPQGNPPSFVEGGKLASPQRRFPLVVFVPPRDVSPWEYEFLLEDLTSQGFVVASLGPALPDQDETSLASDFLALFKDFKLPSLWEREKKAALAVSNPVLDEAKAAKVLVQGLVTSPGDILFNGVNPSLTAVWNAGNSPLDARGFFEQGFSALITPGTSQESPKMDVLQLPYASLPSVPVVGTKTWTLNVDNLHPADLTDMAFLKPFLAFFDLKGRLDARPQLIARAYAGAFFAYALYKTDSDVFSGRPQQTEGAKLRH